jgi:HEAT repeat protein
MRDRTVTALCSLDVDDQGKLNIGRDAERALIRQFYQEPSSRVRRRIVATIVETSQLPMGARREVLLNAATDNEASVRLAALPGLARLQDEDVSVIARYLRDSDPNVRLQATAVLSSLLGHAKTVVAQIREQRFLRKSRR